MRGLAMILVGCGLLLAPAARAEARTPTAAAAASTEAVTLARRYLAAMHMDSSLKPMLLSMTDAMIQQQTARFPNLDDSQRKRVAQAISAAVEETYDKGLLDRMAEKMVPGMAQVFSIAELKALVDFYESPVGQSIIGKMPALGEISGRAIVELMPEMQADLAQRIQKNIEALKLPE